ncbi:MAG TPA: 5'-3' exonuclease [Actinomycetota bacterium]|jgi:5'-3' exonuclease|nr:5'-3' exonuclease [Actinomycetota bacterium]
MSQPRPSRLLLDSPSLVYRAFFALPRSITAPDGQAVNAVRGYLDMLSRLLTDHRPDGVLNVLDADWRPQWRVDAWPGYKATRAEDPPELPAQFPILRAVLEAAGLPVAEAAGYEADDVLGAVAIAAKDDERLAVVTGDRDLLQLIRDPVVWVLFPVKGTSEMIRFDEAEVLARHGIPPGRYVDYAILRGDPSDGLPGLPGVGSKTAARLVNEYSDLDELLAAGDRLPPRVAAALADNGPYLAAMRKVVPVASDAAWTATAAHPPDRDALAALAERHALDGPVERLEAAIDAAGLALPS